MRDEIHCSLFEVLIASNVSIEVPHPTRPDPAWLPRSDKTGHVQSVMAVD
jgi:hypothetical protein